MLDGKKRATDSEFIPEKNKDKGEEGGTVTGNFTGEKKENTEIKKQENETKSYDYSPYEDDIKITIELEKWNREWVKERRREGNYPW